MKKLIFLPLLIIFFHLPLYSQWQWAKSGISAASWDYGNSIATDAAGNAYVIGSFTSASINFGSFTLTNTATSMTDDVFIVKYSSAGNVLWAKKAIGGDEDYGRAITTDASGNVYITGHYYSPFIVFGTDTLFNTGVTDIYTVKYSSAGNEIWAKSGGGAGFDESNTICTDASGNIYIAGQFYSSSMTFGSQTITNYNADTLDMFIVKYSPTGNVLWARSAGGEGNDAIMGITADHSGNIIVTGSSGSPVCHFGSLTLTNPGVFNYINAFVTKYDSNGNALWVRGATGDIFEEGTGVATDTTGNIYVTGYFTSIYTVFGNDTLYNARTIGGPSDIFIVKYNTSGTELWARRAGTRYNDNASGIATDINGNAYITGYYSDTAITFGNTVLSNMGNSDIFVAKYNPSGTVTAAYHAGGTDADESFAISVDANKDIYITGLFYSNNFNIGSSSLHNSAAGYSDMFVAKLNDITGIDEYNLNDDYISIYPNPNDGRFVIRNSKYQVLSIKIFNVLGEEVEKQLIMDNGQWIMDMSNEKKGIYFIQVRTESFDKLRMTGVINKKIIIQ